MPRILFALAVLIAAIVWLNLRAPATPPQQAIAPQAALDKANHLEQDMQEQAKRQMEQIDAQTQQ